MNIEKVTSLDELKTLGYFETIRCVYFTKLLLLTNHTDGQKLLIDVPNDVKDVFKDFDDFTQFLKALKSGNNELLLNIQDDIVTSLLISSWIVFELIIKDLTKRDYALTKDDISADYRKNNFGLSTREKKDLDLFYYIRNAIVHYNGAYFSYRKIDHVYDGHRYNLKGQEGLKISIPSSWTAFKMHLDIEKYAYKAWDNYHKTKK